MDEKYIQELADKWTAVFCRNWKYELSEEVHVQVRAVLAGAVRETAKRFTEFDAGHFPLSQNCNYPGKETPDHTIGQAVIDAIIDGGLVRLSDGMLKDEYECAAFVWSGNAQEQIGAAAKDAMEKAR